MLFCSVLLKKEVDSLAAKPTARKHHYIPQSYLASFTTNGEKTGYFHVMNVLDGNSFKTSPKNVAAERDFNRVDIDGQSPDVLENALSTFENAAALAIRRVLSSCEFPDEKDYNSIINLIALLVVRNPARRKAFNQSKEQEFRVICSMLASDEKLWTNYMRDVKNSGNLDDWADLSFEEFKSFIEEEKYDFVFHPQENLRVEFEALDNTLDTLASRTWSLLLVPPDGPEFICCDHPVTLTWKGGRKGNIGYALRQTEVFFPLGRHAGFYGVFEDTLKPIINCRPLNVAIMNRHITYNAEPHIYSGTDKFIFWHNGSIQEIKF